MDYKNDSRIVMTLDAGGTNLEFSAIQRGIEIIKPVRMLSCTTDKMECLSQIVRGFKMVSSMIMQQPAAISFAFPGPADYQKGIIGDLPNFPCFTGGFALGPALNRIFHLPVFINNDGNLFAYGEAMSGTLPYINKRLEEKKSEKRFHNLIGITLGTGFGCGVVINNRLVIGDNATGGDIWCFRNKRHSHLIVEESVSIRAVKRVYQELSGTKENLTPKDIFDIAEQKRAGDTQAARRSFEELGEMAGDALASAVTIVDGMIIVGGGLAGASKYIIPSIVKELNYHLKLTDGTEVPRIQMRAYNLDEETEWKGFIAGEERIIPIPQSNETVKYDPLKRIGVMTTRQSTSQSIAMGAYLYALSHL
ncbi:ROK family protein [uncultured Bacteroides sp.]|uniref:ROK family protein n=1 Tax=uncultured Bacteroides sp. TaxID=162156 RepID=UPI002AABC4F8|nr:ROK family protein [uncultured Bacteroides sp.]